MRILFVLLVAIIATGCQSLQPPKYEIGQTFQNAFVVGGENTAVPLPEGKWMLVGYNQRYVLEKGR